MKVRVLWPTAFQFLGEMPEAGDVVDVDETHGKALLAAGSAEVPAGKVERTTKAPGEARSVSKKAGA